jgi:hypothetical protein
MARRRGTLIWLGLMGLVVLAIGISSMAGAAGALTPFTALLITAAYLAAGVVMLRRDALPAARRMVTRANTATGGQNLVNKMTPAARSANAKARARPDYGIGSDHTMLDVGLLINNQNSAGRWQRRLTGEISYDDGAIQPYLKLHVSPDFANTRAQIEFELYDRSGQLQFSHTMEEYLREGENLIPCQRQLSLRGNETRGRVGTWDLRIKVDGSTVAIHEFGVNSEASPEASTPNSKRLSATDGYENSEAPPVSLEDLLREQARRTQSDRR